MSEKIDYITEGISTLSVLPFKLLPSWYWGAGSLASFAAIMLHHNAVVSAPLQYALLPIYGPFIPMFASLAVLLAILLILGSLLGIAWTLVFLRDASVSLFRWVRNKMRRKNKSATDIMSEMSESPA